MQFLSWLTTFRRSLLPSLLVQEDLFVIKYPILGLYYSYRFYDNLLIFGRRVVVSGCWNSQEQLPCRRTRVWREWKWYQRSGRRRRDVMSGRSFVTCPHEAVQEESEAFLPIGAETLPWRETNTPAKQTIGNTRCIVLSPVLSSVWKAFGKEWIRIRILGFLRPKVLRLWSSGYDAVYAYIYIKLAFIFSISLPGVSIPSVCREL